MSEADKYSNHKIMKVRAPNFKGEGVNSLVIEVARQGKLPSPDIIDVEFVQLVGPIWPRLEVRQNQLGTCQGF